MPSNISIPLNDPDIAKELIYEIHRLHGYGFIIRHTSDATSDKWEAEKQDSLKRSNTPISISHYRGSRENELSDESSRFCPD